VHVIGEGRRKNRLLVTKAVSLNVGENLRRDQIIRKSSKKKINGEKNKG